MIKDNVQICVVLRNFKTDESYLRFEDFFIEKLEENHREQLCKDLSHFNNYPYDAHIAIREYYIGRGKSLSVFDDNIRAFIAPLFIALRLFSTGQLLMPMAFYHYRDRWHQRVLHGTNNYGDSHGVRSDQHPYILNRDNVQQFEFFLKAINPKVKPLDLIQIPYCKPPHGLERIDMRCQFALHILRSITFENKNPFASFDWLLAITNALESLYLLKTDKNKSIPLSSRIAIVLGQDTETETFLINTVTQFYKIRNAIVHGSLLDEEQYTFAQEFIWAYLAILRKSILAFMNVNEIDPQKEMVVKQINNAQIDKQSCASVRASLQLLKLAKS